MIWLGCGNDVTITEGGTAPDCSTDGQQRLPLSSTRGGHDDIYVMNPNGRNVVNLTKNGGDYYEWDPGLVAGW